MKKCISISLVILLLINSGGFLVILYQAQCLAKYKMAIAIQKGDYGLNNYVKFRIHKEKLFTNSDGFTWKDNFEFEYNGMLFDIIRTEEHGSFAVLYCINDTTEQKIVQSFNDEVSALACEKLNKSIYKTSLLNLISQALCVNPFYFNQPDDKQKYLLKSNMHIISFPAIIPTPPPKTA